MLKLVFGFLIYSFLTEIAAFFIGTVLHKLTFYLYNIWSLANSYFYFYFFHELIKNNFKKNIIKIIALVYTVISVIDISFFSSFTLVNLNYNILFSSIFIVISVLLYFTELLQSEVVLKLNKSMFFWVSIGVLFFNIGTIPIYVIAELLNYQGLFDYIVLSLNLIMAGCFITGFIVSKKKYSI